MYNQNKTTNNASRRRALPGWAGGVFASLGIATVFVWWTMLRGSPPEGEAATTATAHPPSFVAPPSASPPAIDEGAIVEQLAARDPAQAVSHTRWFAARNPGQTRDIGYRLIAALQKNGAYSAAADFAVNGHSGMLCRDLTIAAYHEWGRQQPDKALASAIRVNDPATLDFATQSVLSGWARSDPEGMAEAALAFPESEIKKAALTKALRSWMHKDPHTAGEWIMARDVAVAVADEFFSDDRR